MSRWQDAVKTELGAVEQFILSINASDNEDAKKNKLPVTDRCMRYNGMSTQAYLCLLMRWCTKAPQKGGLKDAR